MYYLPLVLYSKANARYWPMSTNPYVPQQVMAAPWQSLACLLGVTTHRPAVIRGCLKKCISFNKAYYKYLSVALVARVFWMTVCTPWHMIQMEIVNIFVQPISVYTGGLNGSTDLRASATISWSKPMDTDPWLWSLIIHYYSNNITRINIVQWR